MAFVFFELSKTFCHYVFIFVLLLNLYSLLYKELKKKRGKEGGRGNWFLPIPIRISRENYIISFYRSASDA
jgi:hypothetical protein